MLKSLLIRNYALIKHLEMTPSARLNIITGETGAGKSIMLGALGLLLGNRADTKSLLNAEDKCVIEAQFEIQDYQLQELFEQDDIDYEHNCIIRREINTIGKSRAFVNDTPVTLDFVKKIGAKLMDIHSQHETLALGNSSFQLSIIDAFAANRLELETYKELYKKYKQTEALFENLNSKSNQDKAQLSFNTFLYNELEEAQLEASEQEVLEQKLKVLENSEEIKTKLVQLSALFQSEENNIIANLVLAEKLISQLTLLDSSLNPIQQRLKSSLAEIKDLSFEIENFEQSKEYNPNELPLIESRLSLIYHLLKKHSASDVNSLLNIKEKLKEAIGEVENLEEKIEEVQKQLTILEKELLVSAEKLTHTRIAIIPRIVAELETLLKEVGIINASIKIDHQKVKPNNTGADEIAILFSANKGMAPQELKNVASGGEFSRLMLCIKYLLADKTALPTIIFDEIDTGISGEIARKVGSMMKQMASKHQVISISHLPQIAAQGDKHYFVFKDNSEEKSISKMKELTQEERIQELAQMLSGAQPTASAIVNAKELLNMN